MKIQILTYLRLMRFDKPIGTVLLLWPVLWSLWIANQGLPSLSILFIFISGVIVTRAAGCVINDIADRHFDGHVHRTQQRPLVTGAIKLKQAIILFVLLLIIALFLVLQLNTASLIIAFYGAGLMTLYPFTKRFFRVPQLILGLAFNSGVLMSFTAIVGHINFLAILVYLISLTWTLIYDTFYALTDQKDDEKLGLNSSAIFFGRYTYPVLIFLHCMMFTGLIIVGILLHQTVFWFSLVIAGLYSIYLMRLGKKSPFNAFLKSHYLGLIIWIGMVIGYALV